VRLRLIVVGRGAAELAAYEARFLSRLKPFAQCSVHELPEGRGRQAAQRRQEEACHIMGKVGERFILLDERGRPMRSRDVADWLARQTGNAAVDIVIGGAGGVADEVRQAADAVWSLSALTMPHQLVRAIVLEQVYRGFTILSGHPYHRE
jgi:23S rRNA (pseudouridine1915-N3)-methyltransferase